MTATARVTTPTATTTDTSTLPLLWKSGLVSGTIAAAATTATAIAARAVDIPLAVAREKIPLAGFAQLTLFATAVGIALAALAACPSPAPWFRQDCRGAHGAVAGSRCPDRHRHGIEGRAGPHAPGRRRDRRARAGPVAHPLNRCSRDTADGRESRWAECG